TQPASNCWLSKRMFLQLTPHFVSSPFRPPAPHDVFWNCTGITIKKMILQRLYTLRRRSLLESICQPGHQFIGTVLLLLFNVRAKGGKYDMEAVYFSGSRRVAGTLLMVERDLSSSFCFFFFFWSSYFLGFTVVLFCFILGLSIYRFHFITSLCLFWVLFSGIALGFFIFFNVLWVNMYSLLRFTFCRFPAVP